MKTLNLIQGTPEWKEARAKMFTASEAPAMMGASKYTSREDLLREKKTGVAKEVSPAQQRIFDRGHATEAGARPLVEESICEELYPVTGQLEDTKYLASFDGLTMMEDVGFEHKLWNETLAENVRAETLEPHYYWQLEHQLMVSGAEKIIFVTSDGTHKNFESMEYFPVEGRREALIAGWEQFEKDLEAYEVEAKAEVVEAEQVNFPALAATVTGSLIESNINDVLAFVKSKAESEIEKKLVTDLDFANAEQMVKDVKAARAAIKDSVAKVQGEFVSFSEFSDVAAQIDTVLQKLQSAKEKAVKTEKENRKNEIIKEATIRLAIYIDETNEHFDGVVIPPVAADFRDAIKGKRNLQSMADAVAQVLADAKIQANQYAAAIDGNLQALKAEADGLEFLFSDLQQIVTKDRADFINLVKLRVSEHKQAEEERKFRETEAAAKAEQAPQTPFYRDKVVPTEMSKKAKTPFTIGDLIDAWAQQYEIDFSAKQILKERLRNNGVSLTSEISNAA